LAGEAYEEEAKKPSIGIIDAQEEHAEADEKKEAGKTVRGSEPKREECPHWACRD
jgi:hypothetical protein